MNNEIEVGEWIRTEDGQISKNNSNYNWDLKETYINDSPVIKHSKNKIDLIEVGDYVNGDRMDIVERDENGHVYYLQNWELPSLNKNDIKSIVTKEQFASVEYVF